MPYSFFRAQVEDGNVKEISSRGDVIQGEFRRPAKPPASKDEADDKFETVTPTFAKDDELLALLLSQRVVVNAKEVDEGRPLFADLLLFFGPTLLLVGLLFCRDGGGPRRRRRALGGFGRSQAKLYQHIRAAHHVRRRGRHRGGRAGGHRDRRLPERPREIPEAGRADPARRAAVGPPGTGKTLLARAVAGEAQVPFFSISASEFIEMIVGVGASRVRDLFDQAKKVAPVDHLHRRAGRDRPGPRRRRSRFGGNDEREQTLNQILTEMDGFTGSEGVVVLAATNRPEILDPALLRPGRFDRRVDGQPARPDGRRKILEVHTRGRAAGAPTSTWPDRVGHARAWSAPT